jgi:hypothetical protein
VMTNAARGELNLAFIVSPLVNARVVNARAKAT